VLRASNPSLRAAGFVSRLACRVAQSVSRGACGRPRAGPRRGRDGDCGSPGMAIIGLGGWGRRSRRARARAGSVAVSDLRRARGGTHPSRPGDGLRVQRSSAAGAACVLCARARVVASRHGASRL